jgi:predicted nuclease of predicted toxin-antitoxin system
LKLLLDEMYASFIAEELRARGHDVTSVHEAPGRGTPDEDLFEFARGEGRAIVTENVSDFRPLAEAQLAAGGNHAGVVFTTEKRWSRRDPGGLINALDALLKASVDQPLDAELWL